MFSMKESEIVLFLIVAFIALSTFVSMMKRRRDEIVRQLSVQAEQERHRQEMERKKARKKELKEKLRNPRAA